MKYENSIPRLPAGQYEAVALAPLVYNPFDPDIVLLYANPAQMMLLINALQFEDYEVMRFSCVGESSCSDAIARCYLERKPSLSIPCYGERRYGHAQDDELVMALPAEMMDKALRGMEALYKRGIRYPISHAGAELDVTQGFPMAYGGMKQVDEIRGKDERILLGVTGGIASGKSTVARMLEELGAPIIDFDMLSRVVVEPGKPAWAEIVGYFGEQVLLPDKTLDRKKVSEIVFRDAEKRKKLEGFTHPRIHEEFTRLVKEYAAQDPRSHHPGGHSPSHRSQPAVPFPQAPARLRSPRDSDQAPDGKGPHLPGNGPEHPGRTASHRGKEGLRRFHGG